MKEEARDETSALHRGETEICHGGGPASAQSIHSGDLTQQHVALIAQSVPGSLDNIQDILPLSPLQEGMLFHRLLNEKHDTYVLSTLLELDSAARIEDLARALQKVVNRHDALRSSVLWEHLPRPLQIVHREVDLPVEEVTLDGNLDIAGQLKAWTSPLRQRLQLRTAPLLRLEVAADPHSTKVYAVLRVHHLICDHQSLRTLLSETFACLAGRWETLATPVPLRDCAFDNVRGPEDVEAFFSRKLGDVDAPTAPFGVLDVHGGATSIEEVQQLLGSEVARKVRATAQRFGVSAARLFHAAWALVVAHTSNRDDVVFGTVLLPRRMRMTKERSTLGLSVNTLPLRVSIGDLTADAFVRHVDESLGELLLYSHTSLSIAQRCSAIGVAAPLFTSLLNYRHSVADATSAERVAGIRVLYRTDAWTNYPITATVDDLGDDFALMVHADLRIDARRTLGYLQTALQGLLDALATDPHALARTLTVLPQDERRRLLDAFNDTHGTYARSKRVHELFEDKVRLTPQAVAVTHNGYSLTYSELNAKANQVARRLLDRGVGTDDVVGICIERSTDMIVGVLGILKAGAGYLPLDPSYPPERLQYMIDDAAPRILLTHSRLAPALPRTSGELIELDRIVGASGNVGTENVVATGTSSRDIVYVIYTSGSTGRPKGTAMGHASMINLLEWHRSALPLAPGERVLQFAALSFDVAFQEIFSTLCGGGTLVLLDEWIRKDARALMGLINAEAVERLFLPPLMLQSVAEHFRVSGLSPTKLKDVITAGEQLRISPEVVGLFQHLRDCRLHNHYGPTETHVVTALTLTGAPGRWPAFPTIGRPISNSRIYVLDRDRQPVPLGVAGEIYIGGDNVARGYLNRPQLTSERFIRDPFVADPEARMYKTGDLGRWRPDGTIEYLGRNDDQVKIRGFRIELGEVEAALLRHPQVKEAAVVARESASGQKRLVAYVAPRERERLTTDAMRAHLQGLLPAYMVPAVCVVIDALPLTPTGKLNRRALPAPEPDAFFSRVHEAPQGEIEERLATIWQALLGVSSVGRRDGFFELGGDSLMSMRLVVKVAESFGVMLHVNAVFQNQDLCDMARLIERSAAKRPDTPGPMLEKMEEGVI